MYKKIIILLIIVCFPFFAFAKASSTIVMEVNSGRVLYENNANSKRLIASITKIMTCIIVLENVEISSQVTVGDEVLNSYGTNIYIKPGEVLTVEDLLYGLMLRSGNDAASTLAIYTSGSEEEFVKLMNDKAKKIGMNNTIFNNPHGLDDKTENYSTAYDMALLSRYAYQNETYRKIISTKKYETKSSLKSYVWYNRVSLLNSYDNCIGGKNGYTPKAGKTLVSLAKKDNLLLTVVTLNDDNIYEHHEKLYEEFFDRYHYFKIVDRNSFRINPSLIFDKNVFIRNDFYYPLSDDEIEKISTFIRIDDSNKEKVGRIEINFDNKKIGEIPIFQENKKEDKKSIFHWFKKLFV